MLKTVKEGEQEKAWQGSDGDTLEIVQRIKIWQHTYMGYAKYRNSPRWHAQHFLEFWYINGLPILGQMIGYRLVDKN